MKIRGLMPVRIKNKSSESRCPSKYQNSLRSDPPLVSYKYLIFLIFPLPLAPQLSNLGKRLSQVNLCSSLTHLPIFIVLARPEAPNSPNHWTHPSNSRKESESSTVTTITYQGHLLILSTKLHLDSSTLSIFQDFSLQLPPCQKMWSGFEIRALRHEFLLNLKSH